MVVSFPLVLTPLFCGSGSQCTTFKEAMEVYMATAGTHYKTFSQIFYDGLVHPSSIGYFAGRFLQADAL